MWAFFPGALAFVGSALYLFLRIRPKKSITSPPGVDRGKQSLPVKGEPGVYKSGLISSEDQNVIETVIPEVTTLWEAFLHGVKASGDGPCLGEKGSDGKYTFRKYSEIHKESQQVASALAGELRLKKGEKIGIYSQNRPEWTITALAAMQQSVVVVPLYDTLGADAAAFIVSQTEISAVLVDTVAKAQNLSTKKAAMPTLKTIIMVKEEDITKELVQEMKTVGVNIIPFSDLVKQGAKNPQPAHLPTRDDIYIICYTSGTTGRPKGVILTHKNVMANMSGWILMAQKLAPEILSSDMVALSYLPLSHMMEEVCHWTLLMYGARVGFYSGSISRLTEDIQALKPTAIMAVPRILNRLFSGIQAQVQSGNFITKMIYNIARAKKLELLIQGINTKESIWDKLVFDKVQKQLGGNVTVMVTGSAPLSEEVLQTCRLALGSRIIEGYGQTECTAIATLSWPGDWTGGHCGGVAPCSNIKLADVPELHYYAKDGRGEIMIRGPNVTQGYYKDPERTAELFDEHGFIHSGDIGELQPNGTFKIIDRRKHIFKLAQGEYVAPEKIENVYIRSPVLQQVFVDGDSLERWLIAIVVPQPKVMQEWNAQNGVAGRSLEEIYKDKKAQEYVLSQLHEIGKENKLNSIEQVKRVYLETELFSVENDLLTPTLKAKRPQLRQKYKDIMKKIYDENRNL